MSCRMSLRLATAGALAITLVLLPAFGSAARDRSAATTEFSAQSDKDKKQENKNQKKQEQQQIHQQKQQIQQQKVQQKIERREQVHEKKQQVHEQKQLKRQDTHQQKQQIQQLKKSGQIGGGQNKNVKVKVFTPSGPNAKVVTAVKIRGISARGASRFAIRGQNYSAWRSGYRVRHGDGWRTFVALSALGVLAIGAANYYPYAYIDSPADFCEGLTEDGCQLNFDEVETMEGDVIGQCVAYCPWQ